MKTLSRLACLAGLIPVGLAPLTGQAEGVFLDSLQPQAIAPAIGADPNLDATYDLFGKPGALVTQDDIQGVVRNGAALYTTPSAAFLTAEGQEPVLLSPRADGGIDAFYICRYIPICALSQQ